MSLIFKNLSSNLALYTFKLVVGIITLPVCLHAFNEDVYGLYLLAFGLSSSLTAFDLGANKSAMRFAMEYREDDELAKFNHAINVSMTLSAIAGILIAVVLLILGYFGDYIFHLEGAISEKSMPVFILAACNSALLTFGAIPQQLLQANNHFHIRNKWQYLPQVGNILVLAYISITHSTNIVLYAGATICMTVLSLLIDVYLVKFLQILKQVKLQFTLSNKSKTIRQYSTRAFFHALVSFLAVQADKLIIGTTLNVSAITTYTIISKPYYLLRALISNAYPVFQPTLSKLSLQANPEQYNAYSSRVIRSTFIIVTSICCLAAISFEQGLELWLSTSEYNKYAIWGMLSLVTVSITMLYTPHYRTMVYSRQLISILRFSIIVVPINVITSIILTNYLDFYGVIIGTFVQIVLECGFILFVIHNTFNLSYKTVITKSFVLQTAGILAVLAAGRYVASVFNGDQLITWSATAVAILILTSISFRAVRKEKPFSMPITNSLTQ